MRRRWSLEKQKFQKLLKRLRGKEVFVHGDEETLAMSGIFLERKVRELARREKDGN